MTNPSAEMRAGLPDHLGYIGDGDLRLIWQASHNAAVEACEEACTDQRYAGPISTHPEHLQAHNAIHNGACDDCAAAIRDLKVTK